jgi:hypothetical protein
MSVTLRRLCGENVIAGEGCGPAVVVQFDFGGRIFDVAVAQMGVVLTAKKWTATAYQWTAQGGASTKKVDHIWILVFTVGGKRIFRRILSHVSRDDHDPPYDG